MCAGVKIVLPAFFKMQFIIVAQMDGLMVKIYCLIYFIIYLNLLEDKTRKTVFFLLAWNYCLEENQCEECERKLSFCLKSQ